jgi:hypothetical protein
MDIKIKKPQADEKTPAWGFTITTSHTLQGQVFWLPFPRSGLPIAILRNSGTPGCAGSVLNPLQKRQGYSGGSAPAFHRIPF